MDRITKLNSFVVWLGIIVYCSVLYGCHRSTAAPQAKDDLRISQRLCQDKDLMTIALRAGGNLAALDACNTDINRSISLTANSNNLKSYDYLSNKSPNGFWTAKQTANSISIEGPPTHGLSLTIQTQRIMSSPKWSPDSKLVFYVTVEDLDRQRSLSGFDDVFDVHVICLDTSSQALVGRVSAGVPYDSLRWFYH